MTRVSALEPLRLCQSFIGQNRLTCGKVQLRELGPRRSVIRAEMRYRAEGADCRSRLFGVEHWLGTCHLDSGEIKHVWPKDKACWAQRLREELRIPKRLMAAVGDSSGDIELLTTSGHAFYVGRDLPTEIDGCIHLPNASILIVCEHILKRFGIEP